MNIDEVAALGLFGDSFQYTNHVLVRRPIGNILDRLDRLVWIFRLVLRIASFRFIRCYTAHFSLSSSLLTSGTAGFSDAVSGRPPAEEKASICDNEGTLGEDET